jgi:hypothetical protein
VFYNYFVEEYVPAFSFSESDVREAEGAMFNSFKLKDNAVTRFLGLNGKYVSTEYFQVLGSAMAAYATIDKAEKTGAIGSWLNYSIGQSVKIPGFKEAYKAFYEAQKKSAETDETTVSAFGSAMYEDIPSDLFSYFMPMARNFGVAAKTLDQTERRVNRDATGLLGMNTDRVYTQLPKIRESLPQRTDVFGRTTDYEGINNVLEFFSSSRFSYAKDKSPVVNEIISLDKQGVKDISDKPPVMINFHTSKRKGVQELKSSVSFEEFQSLYAQFGKQAHERATRVYNSPEWEKSTDSEKVSLYNKAIEDEYKTFMDKKVINDESDEENKKTMKDIKLIK